MIAPRRFLPSISSLLALEAVGRLGTATAAAEELSLTHSAVSRQLKALEEQIGVRLLVRDGKGLALTPSGADYAASVRDYLQDLARASLKIRAGGERQSLNLAVLPAFGTHWLLPRLKGFAARHPEITVNLSTRLAPFDVLRAPFDAAIHFGARDWQGVEYQELTREEMIPVAAEGRPMPPEHLLALPLLHLESRPGAWEDWFARHGVPAQHLRGMLFDQFTAMAEAAALGLGVALLPRFLAEAEFARGRLRPLAEAYTPVEGAYWLVWPQLRPVSPALARLLAFLAPSRREEGAG